MVRRIQVEGVVFKIVVFFASAHACISIIWFIYSLNFIVHPARLACLARLYRSIS